MSETIKIIQREISELIAAEYNPRQLTQDQFKQLSDSLTRFGVVDPVIVNKNPERENIVVGGHQRLKVWSSLGNQTIPTVEVDLTLDRERELNVRLNKNSGEWDFDQLANHFDAGELLEWGFEDKDLNFFDHQEEKKQEDLSDSLIMEFKLEIETISESEQEQLYNELIERGYTCKILTL